MTYSDGAWMGLRTNQDRDWEYWLTAYYVEPSRCNLCGNLNWTRIFCTLPGELMRKFTEISMSVPVLFKLQCKVFDILFVPTPVPSMLCLNKPLTVPLWARASDPTPWSSVDAYRLGSPGSPAPDSTPSPPGTASAASDPRSPRSPSSCHR